MKKSKEMDSKLKFPTAKVNECALQVLIDIDDESNGSLVNTGMALHFFRRTEKEGTGTAR